MRSTALMVVGVCIAAAAIAQDGEPKAALPIDLSLQAPDLLAVGMVPNTDDFLFLEWRAVPDATSYIVYKEYVVDDEGMGGPLKLEEGKVDLVRWATIGGAAAADAEELTVIVYAPAGAAAVLWAVSAVIGEAQTPLAWGRLAPMPTAVRASSWAAVKAGR